MKQSSLIFGAMVGWLSSFPFMAVLYLGETIAGLFFLPYDLFDWLARVLPGDIITLAIDAIVSAIELLDLSSTSDAAKSIEQLAALLLFTFLGAILGAIITWIIGRTELPGWQAGAIAGTAGLVPIMLIEIDLGLRADSYLALVLTGLLVVGWGSLIGHLVRRESSESLTEESRAARRAMLFKLAGGSLAVAFGAWGLGRIIEGQSVPDGAGEDLGDLSPTPSPPIQAQGTSVMGTIAAATTRDSIAPAPGTRPELTDNDDFYRIDINTRPVSLDESTWELEVSGLFDNPRNLTLNDLISYPSVTQTITLGCISNRVGGDLIGTSSWTGVRLRDLLSDLGMQPSATELSVEAADGFFETVTMPDLMDPRTMLVYGMNGETLPEEHGFPLRIFIPDRYGMKQPKWITKISAIDGGGSGYWVVRGWSQEARPQIVSVIDNIAVEEPGPDGTIPIGGIAWAGDRGIQKVELSFDGDPWQETQLRLPTLSPLTWVQWRYDWAASSGSHRIEVRATDGKGQLQPEEKQGVRPDGATGYHSESVRI